MSTFAVTAVGTLPQSLPPAVPAVFQFQADGVDLGLPDVDTINVTGNAHVTRGTGETANVATITGPADASEVPFTPGGNISATDVDAALHEVDTENRALSAAALGAANAAGYAASAAQAAADAAQADADAAQAGADASVKSADLSGTAAGQGASMVGTSAGITVQDHIDAGERNLLELVPKSQWAAILDGTSAYDATTELQAMLTAGGSWFIPGKLWNSGPLTASATKPTTLRMAAGCEIKALAGFGVNDRLLTIGSGASMTIWAGSGATLRMRKADYTSGEQRHGVNIFGAAKAHIFGLRVADTGGDCFYVGGNADDPSEDVMLFACEADAGRRQGLSIVNAVKCHVIGGIYQNTDGAAPECGIDIESNLLAGYYLSDILVDGVRTKNNTGGGILVTPQSKANPVNITVINTVSEDDGERGGVSVTAAMAYTPSTDAGNIGKIEGRIFVDNVRILNPKGRGFGMVNWTENAPDTHIGTVTVVNPCSDAAFDTNDIHRCAFLLRSEVPTSGQFGTSVGNVEIDRIIAVDNRATKKMVTPLYLNISDEANKPLKNLTVHDIVADASEWTSVAVAPVVFAATKADNTTISYRKPRYVQSGSITLNASQSGITFYPATSATYTLPLTTNAIGAEFEFFVKNTGGVTVAPNATETIDIYSGGVAGNAATSSTVGSKLKIRAVETGRWEIVTVCGSWA